MAILSSCVLVTQPYSNPNIEVTALLLVLYKAICVNMKTI